MELDEFIFSKIPVKEIKDYPKVIIVSEDLYSKIKQFISGRFDLSVKSEITFDTVPVYCKSSHDVLIID